MTPAEQTARLQALLRSGRAEQAWELAETLEADDVLIAELKPWWMSDSVSWRSFFIVLTKCPWLWPPTDSGDATMMRRLLEAARRGATSESLAGRHHVAPWEWIERGLRWLRAEQRMGASHG